MNFSSCPGGARLPTIDRWGSRAGGRDLLLWILDLLIVPAVGLGEAREFSPVAFSISRRNSRLWTPGCGMSFLPIGSLWVLVV